MTLLVEISLQGTYAGKQHTWPTKVIVPEDDSLPAMCRIVEMFDDKYADQPQKPELRRTGRQKIVVRSDEDNVRDPLELLANIQAASLNTPTVT